MILASIKQQKQRLIKSIEKRFNELKQNQYLTETQTKVFTKEVENINKKSLKELKTLSRGLSKKNVESITKSRVNYELSKAGKTKVSLTSKQIQELGKKGLLEKTKEYLEIPATSKRIKDTQERIASGKTTTYNIETLLLSKRTKDILAAVKKKKEHISSLSDIEYLEEIARRTGIAKYIGLVEDAKSDKTVMDNLKKQFDKVERNDYYNDLLKGADITQYYINNDDFEKTQEENTPFLKAMEN